eukprot:TRINITY_DN1735_c0_g1_i3.p3 TRINITY_DN1735_c0_g1~~TRINITY_DN1735_c0_g1_i3.p3  ORF type:complete len:155 (+),score=45.07 TRINITY_DN1735_c0_g1_i3:44-466(+)
MKLFIALIICSLAVFASADIWSFCGTSADHLKIGSVQITPDPPQKGANITVAASGTLDEQVTGGSAVVKLYYSGIKILDHTYDLCTLDPQIKCPFPQGTNTLKVSEMIPSDAPGGHYTGSVNLNDQNNTEITCIKLDFHL